MLNITENTESSEWKQHFSSDGCEENWRFSVGPIDVTKVMAVV